MANVTKYDLTEEEFSDAVTEVLHRKVDAGEIRPIRAAITIRRLQRPRRLRRAYDKAMEEMPKEVLEVAEGDDILSFLDRLLDWLSKNLPQILQILAMFGFAL